MTKAKAIAIWWVWFSVSVAIGSGWDFHVGCNEFSCRIWKAPIVFVWPLWAPPVGVYLIITHLKD